MIGDRKKVERREILDIVYEEHDGYRVVENHVLTTDDDMGLEDNRYIVEDQETGHFWRFECELPVGLCDMDDVLAYTPFVLMERVERVFKMVEVWDAPGQREIQPVEALDAI